jgi:hypothetical protein
MMEIKLERDPGERDVLVEDAKRFFEESVHSGCLCSVCQGQIWEFPEVTLQDGRTYVGRSAFTLTGSRHALAVLVLVCSNCGETRQVATHSIQEWLKSNPTASEQ